jgi:hypothetical protein
VNLSGLTKSLLFSLVVLAGLGAVAIMAVYGPLNGLEAYGMLMAVTTATAVSGGGILSGPTSNTNLLPHLLLILGILAMTTALGLQHVFTDGEVTGVFAGLFGGGIFGSGVTVVPATSAVIQEAVLDEAVDHLPVVAVQTPPGP